MTLGGAHRALAGELWRRRRLLARGAAGAALAAAVTVALLAHLRAELVAPAPSTVLRDRHGRFLGEVGGGEETGFGYWPLEELPPRVVAATLAVEDRRFHQHPGVDLRAVARALWQNASSGRRISGASTLAMQVARMQRPGPRSLPRKAVEAVTALLLTRRWGREAVLRHYLRIVPYGNQVHGIAYAARRYLDKPVADLSWAEVAFLAAIPQAPGRMNPFSNDGRRRAVERGVRILDLLLDDGDLEAGEHELACQQIRSLRVPARAHRPDEAMHAVLALERALAATGQRHDPIVTTSLDLDLQREASWLTLQAVAEWEERGVGNAALLVLDRASREVLTWVGSSDYFDANHAGAIDYARVPRSAGSTLKPFVYAQALERGVISPATVLDDLDRGAGGITNSDERFLGPLLPRVALATSRNVPAANLLQRVGLDQGFELLRDLGLHEGDISGRRFGLGLAIGGMPVTLERLARAYLVLAGDGRFGELVWWRGQPTTPPARVLSEDTARQITQFLADPMARLPSFPRMGALEYPFPVAVKTGTSSNYHDAWTVAYSRRYLVAAWVGHPDYRSMDRISGYRSAAQLVQRVMLRLHKGERDGLEDVGFPPPRGFTPVRVCALTGQLAGDACDRVFLESFAPGREPTQACTAHVRLAVDRRSGLPATSSTPAEWVEVRTFTDLGPRYAEWQADQGIPLLPRAPAVLESTRFAALRSGSRPPLGGATPRLDLISPEPDLRLVRDPETPPGHATMALKAASDPPVEQVVWYVDGAPFEVTEYPYVARWPLQAGIHTFQARLPFSEVRSRAVSVTVY